MDEAAARSTFLNPDELIFCRRRRVGARRDDARQRGVQQGVDRRSQAMAGQCQGLDRRLIVIASAWETYEPVGCPARTHASCFPKPTRSCGPTARALPALSSARSTPRADRLRGEIRLGGGSPALVNKLGVLYARYGLLAEARIGIRPGRQGRLRPALINLGNVAYLKKDFAGAIATYQEALSRAPNSKAALLGLARTQYELENFPEAGRAFALVERIDPKLASDYAYLASRTDGAARASASASQRAGGGAWSEE